MYLTLLFFSGCSHIFIFFRKTDDSLGLRSPCERQVALCLVVFGELRRLRTMALRAVEHLSEQRP